MSKKVKLELNDVALIKVLHSDEVVKALQDEAKMIQLQAGEGYKTDLYDGGTRKVSSVYTATPEAYQDNLDNNTLLKALGGGIG